MRSGAEMRNRIRPMGQSTCVNLWPSARWRKAFCYCPTVSLADSGGGFKLAVARPPGGERVQ